MRFLSRRRRGVSSIVGSIFFVLIMIVAMASLVTIFNSFTSYNNQVSQAGDSQISAQDTQLSVTGSSFGSFPPSTTSNYNVATSCTATTSTSPTDQSHLFYAAGMWWDFFTCNTAFQYSTSYYGTTWEAPTTIPNLVSGYAVGPYFDIDVVGSTLYLAIASTSALDFQLGIGTLNSGGTAAAPAGTITWTTLPASVATGAQPTGPIQVSVDGAGNAWVAVVQGTCTTATNCAIQIYERLPCATGVPANQGWENSVATSCSNANAPTNYAPTTPNLAALAPNANMILSAPPSALSPTGAILVYETAATAVAAGTTGTIGSAGTVAIYTQNTLGTATWNPITLTGVTDYSLTASSSLFIGDTMYFAGLENAATGQTTGDVKFWSVAFTSISAATNTAEQTIEGTAEAWMAALTFSGTTLALFDAYTLAGATTVQYYTSATLGSIWSSPAITLESSETASITGLSPSANGFGVTWENGANSVRFAALSSFTVTNSSPFAVHLVDLYIYNPATNALVAHYYYNSTEEFDYYVGQGGTMVLPIRFVWAASTSYLVTVGTDTGVTTQLTVTSPPGSTTTCPAGYFAPYQAGPGQTCSTVSAAAAPALTESTSTNTCTDGTATTTEMMDLGVSYTTQASSTGNIRVTLTFNVGTPATAAGLTSKWTLAYGTGTAPACNNGSPQGTTVGQQYTVQTEVASAGSMAQSETVTLSGLSPSTAYWFDVQVSDSSAAAWVYSLASMSVIDEQVTGLRGANLAALQTPAKSCTVSSATAEMAGFATTYTTGAAGAYSGTVKVSLTFNIASPATAAGLTGKWQLAYGTGTAPSCDGASAGTQVGNQYTVETVAAATLSESQTETVSLTGLAQSTTYWFDLQVTDSSAASWIYSNPTLAVSELPTINNLPPNYNFSPNAGTCTDATATTTLMEDDTYYTTPSTGSGTVLVHLAFNVGTPATAAGLTSKWQIAYGQVTTAAAAPACNAASAGTTVGNQYTIETVAAAAGSIAQSEGAVITGLSHGTEYWFALRVSDSSGASWVYSNPELQVIEVMPATVPHDNTVSVSNPDSCSDTTTGAATMMGFATAYSTLSYGTGTIAATLTWKLTMPNTLSDTATYLLTYGTGAPPGCVGALTGTTVGQTYEFLNPAAVATQVEPSITITISGLTPGTTYWFDVRVNPSVTATVSSLPVLTVVEVV